MNKDIIIRELKKIFFLFAFFIGIFLIILFFLKKGSFYFGWKNFSNKNFSFSFKYPSSWSIDVPSQSSVLVYNSRRPATEIEKDGNQEEIKSYSEFYIQCDRLTAVDDSSSAKAYLLKRQQIALEEEKQSCQEFRRQNHLNENEPCGPRIPGVSQNYLGDASQEFTGSNLTAVEIAPYHFSPDYGLEEDLLVKKEYLLLVNHKIACTVDLIVPRSTKQNSLTIKQLQMVVKSLKFQPQ
ncbi:MAG: hypothetical protein QHH09_02420 [Microgenomates group bacterium]|nr:hypothetical protein [Microgenomates group bacterium]